MYRIKMQKEFVFILDPHPVNPVNPVRIPNSLLDFRISSIDGQVEFGLPRRLRSASRSDAAGIARLRKTLHENQL